MEQHNGAVGGALGRDRLISGVTIPEDSGAYFQILAGIIVVGKNVNEECLGSTKLTSKSCNKPSMSMVMSALFR